MRRRVLLASLLLIGLCLGSAIYALSRPFALTGLIAYVVARTEIADTACLTNGDPVPGTYVPYRTHILPKSVILYYAVDCQVPGQSPQTYLGEAYFDVKGLSWTPTGRALGTNNFPPRSPRVAFYVNLGPLPDPAYASVNGQVLTSTVQSVAVSFANGVVQREVPNQGYFVALVAPGVMPCRLELLDAQGSVLEQFDLALPPPIPANLGTCPP